MTVRPMQTDNLRDTEAVVIYVVFRVKSAGAAANLKLAA